jgi:glutaredoxin
MKLFSRVIMPFLLLVYIAVETYAKLHHTSICGSTGCKLAGQLLVFPSIYLNYMGLVAAFGIMVLGWASLKNAAFEKLFFISLYAALGFETIMFAYQFIVNPEPCVFCGGVYGSLIAIALVARARYFLYALPIIVTLWVALSTLAIPKNAPLTTDNGRYLIHSETCPHCKKVKAYFAEHNITYTPILVHQTNARAFLKMLNISSIPVLITREGDRTVILKGDEPIIEHFAAPSKPTESVESTAQSATAEPAQAATPSASSDIPLAAEDKEGCSLDNQLDAVPGDPEGCEQESAVPLR